MSDANLETIYRNIFPGAHWAASKLRRSDWHKYASSPRSSQALAVDVFGTIAVHPIRHEVMNRLAARVGLPAALDWKLEFEWSDPDNKLSETRHQTQVDVVATSDAANALLLLECKFHETGGDCTQYREKRCDGRHPGPAQAGSEAVHRCVLTGKGIRYWLFVPEVFEPNDIFAGDVCPFSGENYQWMRNLALRAALENEAAKKAGLIVVYADRTGLPMNDKISSGAWLKSLPLRPEAARRIATSTYRELIRLAIAAAASAGEPLTLWNDLAKWTDDKIAFGS